MFKATRFFTVLAVLGLAATPAFAGVLITEIVDGTLTGGLPKFVEITNTGPGSVDLSAYSIGNYNNGSTTLGGGASLVLSGTLEECDSYVVSYEADDVPGTSVFFDVYGFDADNLDLAAFINGNDVVALFLGPATGDGSDATLVDIYGRVTESTGADWEYTDSYAFRNVLNANPTFTPAEWFIAGPNALEGADDDEETENLRALTDPGRYEPCGNTPVESITWGQIKKVFE